MSDRPAVILTGGARRIGKAMAVALAGRGYDIFLHFHHSEEEARGVADAVRGIGVCCESYQADLTDPSALIEMMTAARSVFPSASLLINNASRFSRSDYITEDMCLFEEHMAIHVKAPYLTTREFARHYHTGLVVNMIDTKISRIPTAYFSYSLSKKSLAELTQLSAYALAPDIRVNGIAPGVILAPAEMSTPAAREAYLARRTNELPLKTRGGSACVISALNFFIDNPFVTGQIIYADGGEHLL